MFEPKEKLVGKRIYLQKPQVTFEFALKMYEVVDKNRDHIIPWLDWAKPEITSCAEDDYAFALKADEAWKKGERFEYPIYDISTDDFLGCVGVIKRGKDENCSFEIGYWLKKDACGKGYMQEALHLIEAELFRLGAKRLQIRADVENYASNKVAQNMGYELEGVLRQSQYNMCLHQFRDLNLYSKIKNS